MTPPSASTVTSAGTGDTGRSSSKWVRGTKAPVHHELDVREGLEVEGVIPPLSGRLVRMSMNPIGEVGPDHHWFEGQGMVHQIELDGGRPVRYVNRWVRTPEVAAALGEPEPVASSDPHELANTSAMNVAGSLLAMTETCQPFVLDHDLATVARADFGGGVEHFTAHPHTDPTTGEVYGIGYRVDEDPTCTLHHVGADGLLVESTEIELLGARSIHDFAMTARWIVVWDLPVELAGTPGAASRYPYAWNHDGGARIGLLDRSDLAAPVRWFEIEPCWVFHPLNAFDTDRGVQLDVCRFDRIFDVDRTGPGDPYPPQLWRWQLDLERGTMSETLLDERVQEFPRMDPLAWGRPHRMGFTVELVNAAGSASVLAHDVDRGAVDGWSSPVGTTLSEAVFAPDPNAAVGSGDGWLLTVESTTERSDLLVLDATSLASGPVGRVRLPQRIPDGFHGDWIGGTS